MDEELRSVLENAARELSAVADALPLKAAPATQEACDALLRAEGLAEEVAAGVGLDEIDYAAVSGDALLDQAYELRAEATLKRDGAQAELAELRSKRTELLSRFELLTESSAQDAERRRELSQEANAQEGDLQARCDAVEEQVRILRESVQRRNRKLFALNDQSHVLGLSQRKLQRRHDSTMVQNEVAREILELRRSVKDYLKGLRRRQKEVGNFLLVAQTSCSQRLHELQGEWHEQEDKYQRETSSLEDRLLTLDEDYERRWQATEADEHRMMEEKTKKLEDARLRFEAQFAEMDEALSSEKAASQEQAEKNKAVLIEERERLRAAMDAKLAATRSEMNQRVEVERRRCSAIREKQYRRCRVLSAEVNHYADLLQDVQDSYQLGYIRARTPAAFNGAAAFEQPGFGRYSPPLSARPSTGGRRTQLGSGGAAVLHSTLPGSYVA
eukprot:TRINITY_DN26673_c0_g1_i1.p1 TRINITY_DN26673_c0_g1~~TRINITY_DN26673_c0_g1_i1.p1  ORF type:complete len:444 (-),score=146.43 TRINITY_DN26673_c0_g1_i1:81-1412(-)